MVASADFYVLVPNETKAFMSGCTFKSNELCFDVAAQTSTSYNIQTLTIKHKTLIVQ